MSEPSKNPPKRKRPIKVDPELPDDEAIRQLFPKRLVDRVNKEIEHEPKPTKGAGKRKNG